MRGRNVLPHRPRPTQKDYRAAVAGIILDLKAKHRLSNEAMGDRLGCCGETVANAEGEKANLNPVTLLNIAHEFGPTAICTVLQLAGIRGVPIGTFVDGDPLPPMAAAVHKLAVAVSPESDDGTDVSDNECLWMEDEVEQAIHHLTSIKERCIAIRARRAQERSVG